MSDNDLNRREFLRGPLTLVEGVLKSRSKAPSVPTVSRDRSVQNSPVFLDALDALLEKHRQKLVEELSEAISLNIAKQGIALSPKSDRITRAVLEATPAISIDETIFVTDEKISNIEKGFEELAEAKTEQDANTESALNKLRSLKKGN